MLDDKLVAELKRSQQNHLIAHWDSLDSSAQKTFESQLKEIDFAQLHQLQAGHDKAPDWAALSWCRTSDGDSLGSLPVDAPAQ